MPHTIFVITPELQFILHSIVVIIAAIAFIRYSGASHLSKQAHHFYKCQHHNLEWKHIEYLPVQNQGHARRLVIRNTRLN